MACGVWHATVPLAGKAPGPTSLGELGSVDEDLLLVSQIGGLRAKNARAHATTTKLNAAIEEFRGRQEDEVRDERDKKSMLRQRRLAAFDRQLLLAELPSVSRTFGAWRLCVSREWLQRKDEAQQAAQRWDTECRSTQARHLGKVLWKYAEERSAMRLQRALAEVSSGPPRSSKLLPVDMLAVCSHPAKFIELLLKAWHRLAASSLDTSVFGRHSLLAWRQIERLRLIPGTLAHWRAVAVARCGKSDMKALLFRDGRSRTTALLFRSWLEWRLHVAKLQCRRLASQAEARAAEEQQIAQASKETELQCLRLQVQSSSSLRTELGSTQAKLSSAENEISALRRRLEAQEATNSRYSQRLASSAFAAFGASAACKLKRGALGAWRADMLMVRCERSVAEAQQRGRQRAAEQWIVWARRLHSYGGAADLFLVFTLWRVHAHSCHVGRVLRREALGRCLAHAEAAHSATCSLRCFARWRGHVQLASTWRLQTLDQAEQQVRLREVCEEARSASLLLCCALARRRERASLVPRAVSGWRVAALESVRGAQRSAKVAATQSERFANTRNVVLQQALCREQSNRREDRLASLWQGWRNALSNAQARRRQEQREHTALQEERRRSSEVEAQLIAFMGALANNRMFLLGAKAKLLEQLLIHQAFHCWSLHTNSTGAMRQLRGREERAVSTAIAEQDRLHALRNRYAEQARRHAQASEERYLASDVLLSWRRECAVGKESCAPLEHIQEDAAALLRAARRMEQSFLALEMVHEASVQHRTIRLCWSCWRWACGSTTREQCDVIDSIHCCIESPLHAPEATESIAEALRQKHAILLAESHHLQLQIQSIAAELAPGLSADDVGTHGDSFGSGPTCEEQHEFGQEDLRRVAQGHALTPCLEESPSVVLPLHAEWDSLPRTLATLQSLSVSEVYQPTERRPPSRRELGSISPVRRAPFRTQASEFWPGSPEEVCISTPRAVSIATPTGPQARSLKDDIGDGLGGVVDSQFSMERLSSNIASLQDELALMAQRSVKQELAPECEEELQLGDLTAGFEQRLQTVHPREANRHAAWLGHEVQEHLLASGWRDVSVPLCPGSDTAEEDCSSELETSAGGFDIWPNVAVPLACTPLSSWHEGLADSRGHVQTVSSPAVCSPVSCSPTAPSTEAPSPRPTRIASPTEQVFVEPVLTVVDYSQTQPLPPLPQPQQQQQAQQPPQRQQQPHQQPQQQLQQEQHILPPPSLSRFNEYRFRRLERANQRTGASLPVPSITVACPSLNRSLSTSSVGSFASSCPILMEVPSSARIAEPSPLSCLTTTVAHPATAAVVTPVRPMSLGVSNMRQSVPDGASALTGDAVQEARPTTAAVPVVNVSNARLRWFET